MRPPAQECGNAEMRECETMFERSGGAGVGFLENGYGVGTFFKESDPRRCGVGDLQGI
jgi:hypothetical protein